MTSAAPASPSSLADLARALRAQAADGSITLSADLLPAAEVANIGAALLLDGGPITITGVKPTDIPDPAGGALRVAAGTAALLHCSALDVDLLFTVDGSGAVQVTLGLAPEAGWTFGDSFPAMALYPFDGDTLTLTEPRFVYASQPRAGYAPWVDRPQETVDLAAGLNFAGWAALTLTGSALAVLGAVLQADVATKIAGPFVLSADATYPATRLAGTLAAASLPIIGSLTLGGLGVVLEVTAPPDGVPEPQLLLTASFGDLLFTVRVDPNAPGVAFGAGPAPGKVITADQILALPGGESFRSFVPAELTEIFADVALNSFSVALTAPATVGHIGLSIGTPDTKHWTLIPDVLVLDDITLRLDFDDPAGDKRVSASVRATCNLLPKAFTGAFDFIVSLDNSTGKWALTDINGAYTGRVALGALVSGIAGSTVTVPAQLNDIVFSAFGASAARSDGGGYTFRVFGRCDVMVPMAGGTLTAALTMSARFGGAGYDVDLGGALAIGDQDFHVTLALSRAGGGQTDGVLRASWAAVDEAYLEFADIAGAFGFSGDDLPQIPEGLDLALQQAALTYDFGKHELAIGLGSVHYGNAVFAALQDPAAAGKWLYFFGLAAPGSIVLTNLPVVETFAAGAKAEIDDLQVVIASRAISPSLVTTLDALIDTLAGGPYPHPPAGGKGMAAGVSFSMQIVLPELTIPVTVGAGGATASHSAALAAAAPSGGSATWLQIGKSIGPVSVGRIGVQYQSGRLYFLVDASLGLSALTLGFAGLGVGSPLTTFSPEPHLSGLSLAFSSGPVSIEGALLVAEPPFPPNVTEELIGTVVVKVEPYVIGGVVSYAKVSGKPSIVVFAQLEAEIGGSPAFFITGFMGGFGYNSQLTLPAPDQVHLFPFVTGLDDPTTFGPNPTPLKVLDVLSGTTTGTAWVTPMAGAQWIAGGVMFRSFELVLGHVLVVATFGRELQIALLGLASMSLPQGATTDAYAYVELQLEALLKPDEGSFSIIASVTDNSFLLTRDCHLTGGFAFCLWFGDNPHAGDFVVTVGGYHPAFVVPTWYPQAAPVGFNWAVGGGVTAKGGAYFALTPTAAMAGGRLEVLFQSGDLKAWFVAWANMMVRWKPFYFTAGIGISIGASYRLNLLFTSVTVSIELGASLDLWGPPTGGVVHVHWVIISFSVSFGADQKSASEMTLDWSGFKGLLPSSPERGTKLTASAGNDAILLTVSINRGLVRRNEADGSWTVRADELVFTTDGAFPATAVLLGATAVALPPTAPATIDVRPMRKSGLLSTHTVQLWNVTEQAAHDLAAWPTRAVQTRNLPEALWGAPLDDHASPAPASATLAGLPTGIQLTAPDATPGAAVGPFDPSALIDELGGGWMPLDPATQQDMLPAPVVDDTTIGAMMDAAASDAVWDAQVGAQEALVAALATLGAAPPTHAPLADFAAKAGRYFTQAPMRATTVP